MSFYDLFIDMWTHGFMVRGISVTLAAAIVCAVLSCWLVLVGWSLMGDALSHAIMPGVVLAYLFSIPFSAGAFIAALICVGLIGVVRSSSRLKEDTSIGVVFTTLLGIGLVLISIFPSHINVEHVLFGDMLGITRADMIQIAVLVPLALGLVVAKRRDLTLYAFDPTHAAAIGVSVKQLSALLLVSLAITVVVAMQAVGAILIVALLITPGACARLLTDRFSLMLVLSPAISVLATLGGVYVSYWMDAASGAMVVVAHGILFAIIFAATTVRDRLRSAP